MEAVLCRGIVGICYCLLSFQGLKNPFMTNHYFGYAFFLYITYFLFLSSGFAALVFT